MFRRPTRPLETALFVGIVGVGVLFRFRELGWVPGINGDEAWYGLLAQRIVSGRAEGWLTPSGVLPNPVFLALHVLCAALLPPSPVALRVPSLVAGLATLGVAYYVTRRMLGKTAARLMTALVACLPIAIAYSRFSWDSSTSLLFVFPFLYLAWRRHPVGIGVSLWLAFSAHPTNLFAVPAGAVLFFRKRWRSRLDTRRLWALAISLAVAGAGIAAQLAVSSTGGNLRPSLARLVSRSRALESAGNLAAFLLGPTVYEYLPASAQVSPAARTPALLALFLVAALVVARLARRRPLGVMIFPLAFLASYLAGYLMCGGAIYQPHTERYGLFIIAPALFAVCALLLVALRATKVPRAASAAGLFALGALWLSSFDRGYFVPFETTGGNSHPTFRTASPEPKSVALATLRASAGRRPASTKTAVLAGTWWLRIPLRYLDAGRDSFEWVEIDEESDARGALETIRRQRGMAVVFAGSRFDEAARSVARPLVIPDRGGRPLVHVYDFSGDAGSTPSSIW